jgi:hypothetical protein
MLTEEHRMRVYETEVLRIFGPKRDEAIQGWRKLYNEEPILCILHKTFLK